MLPAGARNTWSLFKDAVDSWTEDYAPSMGAALAYYTLFSIAPLLLIVIGLAGLVFGDDAARGEIFGQLRGLMGALVAALGKLWGPAFKGWETLAHLIDILISFGMVTVMFALIYKIIPRVRIRWHDVWIGAAVTAALFAVGKFLIGLYLGKSSVASAFGAAGSLVVMMVWVYYSAQIFLLGAEFTWVYAHTYGSRRGQPRPRPEESAGVEPR